MCLLLYVYIVFSFVCVCVYSYHSALSEMAVHTTCKGAVMILGKPDNNESQVGHIYICVCVCVCVCVCMCVCSYIHTSNCLGDNSL